MLRFLLVSLKFTTSRRENESIDDVVLSVRRKVSADFVQEESFLSVRSRFSTRKVENESFGTTNSKKSENSIFDSKFHFQFLLGTNQNVL